MSYKNFKMIVHILFISYLILSKLFVKGYNKIDFVIGVTLMSLEAFILIRDLFTRRKFDEDIKE